MHRQSSSILTRSLVAIALALLPLSLCSCLNSPASSSITSQGNRLEMTIKAPIAHVGAAARDAMVQQKMAIVAYSVTATDGRIVGYTPKGARIELTIHPADAGSSKIAALTNGSEEADDAATTLLARIASKAS
jgi:hypothetical protein